MKSDSGELRVWIVPAREASADVQVRIDELCRNIFARPTIAGISRAVRAGTYAGKDEVAEPP